jgi:hypothetical protein
MGTSVSSVKEEDLESEDRDRRCGISCVGNRSASRGGSWKLMVPKPECKGVERGCTDVSVCVTHGSSIGVIGVCHQQV